MAGKKKKIEKKQTKQQQQQQQKANKKEAPSFEAAVQEAQEKFKPKAVRWGVAHIFSSKNNTIITLTLPPSLYANLFFEYTFFISSCPNPEP